MAYSLNFTIAFYETFDASTEQWGRKSESGSFSGLLGEMVTSLSYSVEMFMIRFSKMFHLGEWSGRYSNW